MTKGQEAVHRDPIWRERADFIVAAEIDPGNTEITTEQLWARKLDDRHFEICCIPFFVFDLALGDIVEVDERYLVRTVASPSGRYVFRVHFARPNFPFRDDVILKMDDLGALVEWSLPNMFAVDARDLPHAQQVADLLFDEEGRGHLDYETGKTA